MSSVEDTSTSIKDSIHEILFNIQYGMLLAVIVIFLFLLDLRPTIIAGLSIPISLVATFTIMKLLGFTINVLTLLGLSLAVGILIDDAIVVMENIYRHIHMGKSPIKAAMDATKEIGLAVMATTFSIVVVFVPVAFMEGLIGRFFYQFGMTVAFAVVISLFVALTLTPMLSSRWLREGEEEAAYSPRGMALLARVGRPTAPIVVAAQASEAALPATDPTPSSAEVAPADPRKPAGPDTPATPDLAGSTQQEGGSRGDIHG